MQKNMTRSLITFAGAAAFIMLLGAGCVATVQKPESAATMEKKAESVMVEKKAEGAAMEKNEGTTTEKKEEGVMMKKYSGAVLAGTSAALIDYNQADYDAAVKTDKLIVLYFYANWCPLCKAEVPKLYAAFNQLTTDQVIGFRVNYNDNETDPNEEALARTYGVPYQHTKVFVKAGTQVLKSPESWDTARYLSEIHSAIGN
jgi:thiol-disulfide isomerase/thioredoxin